MMELGPKQLKWIEALESGEYKQGTQLLRNLNDEYCCLGVACDLYGVPWSKGLNYYHINGIQNRLTDEVAEELKFYGCGGKHKDDDENRALWMLNDCDDFTFKEIAQVIRNNPEHYFTESA